MSVFPTLLWTALLAATATPAHTAGTASPASAPVQPTAVIVLIGTPYREEWTPEVTATPVQTAPPPQR